MSLRKIGMTVAALLLGFGSLGCQTHTGNAALIGGAGGALAGAAIGSHSHSRAGAGALVGGAIGAVGGAIVGNEMDRQENGGYGNRTQHYDDTDYYVEHRSDRPRYQVIERYDDCPPPRYEYRSRRTYGHGVRYYGSTYYGY